MRPCTPAPVLPRAGWGRDVVGMVLGPDADWGEVAELLTESFCVITAAATAGSVPRQATT